MAQTDELSEQGRRQQRLRALAAETNGTIPWPVRPLVWTVLSGATRLRDANPTLFADVVPTEGAIRIAEQEALRLTSEERNSAAQGRV
jgi:hypothetical protein